MTFRKMLTIFRERNNFSKTGLAEKIGVTPTTVMEWESGRKKPPSKERCLYIAGILSLAAEETTQFIDAAMEERASPEIQTWISERLAVYQVPVVSYSNIPKTSSSKIHIDETTQFIHIAEPKGEFMFAVQVENSLISGEFKDGDLVIIDTQHAGENGDHVLVYDGEHRLVRVTTKTPASGEIIGRVWAKYKKY